MTEITLFLREWKRQLLEILGTMAKLSHSKNVKFAYALYLFQALCMWNKVELVGHCLRAKQYDDKIHSSRNLKMVCCTVWHSLEKIYMNTFECLYANLMSYSYSYWWKPNLQSKSSYLGRLVFANSPGNLGSIPPGLSHTKD